MPLQPILLGALLGARRRCRCRRRRRCILSLPRSRPLRRGHVLTRLLSCEARVVEKELDLRLLLPQRHDELAVLLPLLRELGSRQLQRRPRLLVKPVAN